MAEEIETLSFGQRRVTKIKQTLLTSLPKEWTKNRGIDERNNVEILLTANNNLLIRPVKERDKYA
jgi:hypothetical protein